jgi:toxin HigB-1
VGNRRLAIRSLQAGCGAIPPQLPPENAAAKTRPFSTAGPHLGDLRNPPGNHLEALRADRAGQWIRIDEQWRICFRWSDGEAHDVEIADYH